MFYGRRIREIEERIIKMGERIMMQDHKETNHDETLKELERKILLLKSDISHLNDKVKKMETLGTINTNPTSEENKEEEKPSRPKRERRKRK